MFLIYHLSMYLSCALNASFDRDEVILDQIVLCIRGNKQKEELGINYVKLSFQHNYQFIDNIFGTIS